MPFETTFLLSLAAVAGLSALPNARAICVQNDLTVMTEGVYVWFDCGFLCNNFWTLRPGQSACRPAKAGHLWGQSSRWSFGQEGEYYRHVPLDDPHGYAVISDAEGGFGQVCVYKNDDSLVLCAPFKSFD